MSQSLRVTCGNCGLKLYAISKVTDANRQDVADVVARLGDTRDAHLFHLGCTLALNAIYESREVSRG